MGRVKRLARTAIDIDAVTNMLEDHLVLNVDVLKDQFDSCDLEFWTPTLTKFAVAETDRARASGFLA